MSGRSAYVRKKITETRRAEGLHLKNTREDVPGISELPSPAATSGFSRPDGTGTSSSSSRFPRFTESPRETNSLTLVGSHGRESVDGKGNPSRPLDDFAYARARKPTIKTEDVSGITKSGVRSAYDKRSEDVRKGLAKAFSWGKRSKRGEPEYPVDTRQEPGATMRPTVSNPDENNHQGSTYPSQVFELPADSNAAGPPICPPPASTLPPLPPGPQIWRWIGTGRTVQRWNKLRKDPELWNTNGDVLIYLGSKGQQPKCNPSLRLSSHIIEATESRQLVSMLREGFIDDQDDVDNDDDENSLPPSPSGLISGHNSSTVQSTSHIPGEASTTAMDSKIRYEIYFPPPSNANKVDQLRHHLATRNVFAVLCHVSLVGLSLHQTLSDLHARLEEYTPPGHVDNLLTIMSYISARGIDDVRNDAETAVGLLAWSEDPKVRWEEAWRESFVHAAGLYGTSRGRSLVESCADFKNLSPITRALLERASLETQLRVQAAEERLATFSFTDMWPVSVSMIPSFSGASCSSAAKEAADRLQRFFIEYYRNLYGGRWPPPPPTKGATQESHYNDRDETIWLTRTVTKALQKDFGALYDYLVNRDIVWDVSETRPSRKWLMISESRNKAFDADTAELPMTDMLIEFDNKQRFPHIPHPYPLVPEFIPAQPHTPATLGPLASPVSAGSTGGSMNFLKRNRANTDFEGSPAGSVHRPSAAIERRVHLAYTESTNIYILGSEFSQPDLIDAYVKFEKADRIGELDPNLARRARWVLIYGILQTLASVAVDAPSVRYREGVPYHLSPQLKGARIPPWGKKAKHAGTSNHNYMEASHELSYCWMAQLTWTTNNTSASEEDGPEDDMEDELGPQSPSLLVDQDKFGYGFHYPPPLALSTRRSQSSSGGGSSTRVPTAFSISSDGGHSDAGVSTATTSATATLPMSPLTRNDSLKHHSGAGRAKTLRGRGSGPMSPTARSRIDEGEGGWSPVRKAETGYERRRRDISDSSDATTAEGRRQRKKANDLLTVDGNGGHGSGGRSPRRRSPARQVIDSVPGSRDRSPSPGVIIGKMEGADGQDGTKVELKPENKRMVYQHADMSGMGPLIRDFDELDVDDIMP